MAINPYNNPGPRPLTFSETRLHFGHHLDTVEHAGRPIVIRRRTPKIGFRDAAILMSVAEYERLKEAAREFTYLNGDIPMKDAGEGAL